MLSIWFPVWKSLGLLLVSSALSLSAASGQERDRPPREQRGQEAGEIDRPQEQRDRPEGQRERVQEPGDRPREAGQRDERTDRRPADQAERVRRPETPGQLPGQPRESRNGQLLRVGPERMEELLAFASRHQPGVARLLHLLETRSPERHAKAVQALDRDVRRLEAMQLRDGDLYHLALERWKNRSGIDLALAQLELRRSEIDSPAGQEMIGRLKELVRQQEELKRKQLKVELNRARARIERLEQQLTEAGEIDSSKIDKTVRDLMGRLRRQSQNADRPDGNRPDAGQPGDRRPESGRPDDNRRPDSAGPPRGGEPDRERPRPPREGEDRRREGGGRLPEALRPEGDGGEQPPATPDAKNGGE